MPTPNIPELLTRREAGDLLRRSDRSIDALIKDGKLTAHRVGKRVLISRDEIAAFLERNIVGQPPPEPAPGPEAGDAVDEQPRRRRPPPFSTVTEQR